MTTKPKPPIERPICLHCNEKARKVSGRVIYPDIPRLHSEIYYKCHPCSAYIGTHKTSGKPLGYPANSQVRSARQHVHKMLDPLWRNAHLSGSYNFKDGDSTAIKTIQFAARHRVYSWLAARLGVDKKTCHTAMFGLEECREAYRLCRSVEYPEIRRWYKEQEKYEKTK